MKPSKAKLYDALGELLYAVAKADGEVQESERQMVTELLREQPWAEEVQWSFDYENRKAMEVEAAYQKALDTCKAYGPTEEYAVLFDALQKVAEADAVVDESEKSIISEFTTELRNHFLNLDF